ncbi:MAG TPA: hypothetical protein ENN30_00850 [Candidatus Woesearchaeota archaeon]|nr:hypothetical protein [Candidatus Woesearchaeota archaeon]
MVGIGKTLWKLVTFKLEYGKKSECKAAAAYFTLVFAALFVVSRLNFFQSLLPVFSHTLQIGSLLYLILSLYFIKNLIEIYVSLNTRQIIEYVFIMSAVFVFLLLGFELFNAADLHSETNTLWSLIISLAVIALPACLSDEIIDKIHVMFPVFLALPAGLNNTFGRFVPEEMNLTMPLDSVRPQANLSAIPYFAELQNFFTGHTLIAVAVVIALFIFLMKYIKRVLKLTLIILIIAIVLKYAGVI